MAGVKQVIVECKRGQEIIARYEIGVPISIGPTVPPPDSEFVDHAKTNLTNQRLAFPPYTDITFNVIWP